MKIKVSLTMVTFRFCCVGVPVIASVEFSTNELPITSWFGGNSINTEGFAVRGTCLQVSVLYLPSCAFPDKSLAFFKPQLVHLLKI